MIVMHFSEKDFFSSSSWDSIVWVDRPLTQNDIIALKEITCFNKK